MNTQEQKNKERTERFNKKRDYEDLRNSTIVELCSEAMELNNDLKSFKKKSFDSMQTIWEMLKEYSSRHADGKGTFTIEFEDLRISYKRQGKATFDERSHQAEKHIIDFVNAKFDNDKDTRDLIMSLMERKKGELDIYLVQKLYAMEDRFDDQNWKKGIELLKESYQYAHSKDYIKFEQRDEKGQWNSINLQFSNI